MVQSFLAFPRFPGDLQIDCLFVFSFENHKGVYYFFRLVSIQEVAMDSCCQVWVHNCIIGLPYGFVIFPFVFFSKLLDQILQMFDVFVQFPSAVADIIPLPFYEKINGTVTIILFQDLLNLEFLALLPDKVWI